MRSACCQENPSRVNVAPTAVTKISGKMRTANMKSPISPRNIMISSGEKGLNTTRSM